MNSKLSATESLENEIMATPHVKGAMYINIKTNG
jgi:hypothetical protein